MIHLILLLGIVIGFSSVLLFANWFIKKIIFKDVKDPFNLEK